MNKKILTLTCAAAICLCAAAKTLKVYSVTGNVTKKAGSSWVKVAKPSTISDTETVKINPSSSLRVLDPSTRQIYTFTATGEHNVSALLRQAAQDNSSLGGKIAAESRRQSAASASKSHKAVGAAKRATLDEEEQEALYAALTAGFEAGANQGQITLEKVPQDDGLFYLALTNNSDDEMYANVFTKDENNRWNALYVFDNENPALLLAPGARVQLDHFLLAEDESADLVAVGYKSAFDGAELTDMFVEEFEPGETVADGVSLFFIK